MDRYKERGSVNCIGKIEGGIIWKGQKILISPREIKSTVVSISVDDVEVDMANAGENILVTLKDVSIDDIRAGDVICSAESPCPKVLAFDAQIQIQELLEHKPLLTNGYEGMLHAHNLECQCEIYRLLHVLQKKTMKRSRKPPAFLKQRQLAIIQVTMKTPVVVETYEDFAHLGRFTIRDEGKTVVIGKIMKTYTKQEFDKLKSGASES